ncbi:hypothetical protein [Bradyrhizobium sp.]|nr:hypothetical protein [Bradyrhizobium sp.]
MTEWGYAGALITAVPVILLFVVLLRGRDAFFATGGLPGDDLL